VTKVPHLVFSLKQLMPRWVAPNLLTFVGFLCVLLTAGLISFFDPDFSASSDLIPYSKPIPNWVWLVCAIFHFLAHTLDGIDGKQARRTGTSGPLGELFDHGLDSWTTLFTPFCIYSIFGRAEYAFPPIRVQFVFWSVFVTFYLSHWEKYNTGILYLPWSYDMTQVALFVMYLLSFWYGHSFWKFDVGGISSGCIFEAVTHIGSYALSIPVTLYNVHKASKAKSLKHKSFGEAIRPLVPLFALFVITVGWSFFSPNDIVDQHPRTFFFLVGTIFSNIAVSISLVFLNFSDKISPSLNFLFHANYFYFSLQCRLIVSQMSSTRCEAINWLLIPLAGSVGCIFLADMASKETTILKFLTVISVLAHLHYGICVVRQMADHFDIDVFSIKRREINNHLKNDRKKLLNNKSGDH